MKSKTKGRATTKNEKIILYVLGLLAIFTLCYIFIIYPSEQKTKNLKNEVKLLETQLANVKSIDYDISQRKKQLEELMVEYSEATVTLPKSDEYPQIYYDVTAMATDSGLDATNGSFSKPKTYNIEGATKENTMNLKGMRREQVSYTITGDLTKVLTFIDKLENHNRIVELNSFSHSGERCTIIFSFYDTGEGAVEEYDFN